MKFRFFNIHSVMATMLLLCSSFFIFAAPSSEAGQLAPTQVMQYPTCWENAGAYYNIDPWVLYSIAYVESRHNPAAINRNKNGTMDISMMQINSIWFPQLVKRGVNPKQLWDGCTSIYVGAWILAQCKQKYGSGWMAVGAYHSGNPRYAKPYALQVNKAYQKFKRYYGARGNLGVRQANTTTFSDASSEEVTVMP